MTTRYPPPRRHNERNIQISFRGGEGGSCRIQFPLGLENSARVSFRKFSSPSLFVSINKQRIWQNKLAQLNFVFELGKVRFGFEKCSSGVFHSIALHGLASALPFDAQLNHAINYVNHSLLCWSWEEKGPRQFFFFAKDSSPRALERKILFWKTKIYDVTRKSGDNCARLNHYDSKFPRLWEPIPGHPLWKPFSREQVPFSISRRGRLSLKYLLLIPLDFAVHLVWWSATWEKLYHFENLKSVTSPPLPHSISFISIWNQFPFPFIEYVRVGHSLVSSSYLMDCLVRILLTVFRCLNSLVSVLFLYYPAASQGNLRERENSELNSMKHCLSSALLLISFGEGE